MKPFYAKREKYKDGRSKICIVIRDSGKVRVKFLPKPEKLLKMLEERKI